jgi:hypothetical protein
MTRAYALALGAGTQVLTLGFGQGIFGKTEITTAVFQALAWVVNLAVAEWALRRPAAPSRRRLALVADAS